MASSHREFGGQTRQGQLTGQLASFKREPLIGLEFLVEVTSPNVRSESKFICLLCDKDNYSSPDQVIQDVLGSEHRLKYLKRYFPKAGKKFEKVPNRKIWERPTYDFLESVALKIEQKFGRLSPKVLNSSDYYRNRGEVLKDVMLGRHFRECSDLDFASLPDPFGSYVYRIDPAEIVDDEAGNEKKEPSDPDNAEQQQMQLDGRMPEDKGLDHIKDPQMQSLMQREIARFRATQSKTNDPATKTTTIEKAPVLKKSVSNNKEEGRVESRKNEEPSRRKSGQSESAGGGDKKGPVRHALWNRTPVDGDRPPGDFNPRDAELIKRKRNNEPQRHQSRNNRDKDHRRRSRTPEVSHNRDRNTRRRPSRDRDRDRDRGDRRRRTRSRSRSRSRSRLDRYRDRSRSPRPSTSSSSRGHYRRERNRTPEAPYDRAMERWRRFKQAEGVMLSSVNRRKDIYDKRPEDHPDYANEWQTFWEKRYRELQLQRKDPENHDYKSEWIVHWANRVEALFRNEVRDKTSDLLRQFDLNSKEEPRREDFGEDPFKSYMDDYEKMVGNRDDDIEFIEERRRIKLIGGSRSRSRSRSRSKVSPLSYKKKTVHILDIDYDDIESNPIRLVSILHGLSELKQLEALQLNQQVKKLADKAIGMEETRHGSSNVLLENSEVMFLLETTREKLNAQVQSKAVDKMQLESVQRSVDNLRRVLKLATRKRPQNPPDFLKESKDEDGTGGDVFNPGKKLKHAIAANLSRLLVRKRLHSMNEYDMSCLICQVAEGTSLDEGNFAPPERPAAIPVFAPPQQVKPPTSTYFSKTDAEQQQQQPSTSTTSSGGQPVPKGREKTPEDDPYEDLTTEELRSLLNNFNNLTKGEQGDLIQYIKRLETLNPQKVVDLKIPPNVRQSWDAPQSNELKFMKSDNKSASEGKTNSESIADLAKPTNVTKSPQTTSNKPSQQQFAQQFQEQISNLIRDPPPPPPPAVPKPSTSASLFGSSQNQTPALNSYQQQQQQQQQSTQSFGHQQTFAPANHQTYPYYQQQQQQPQQYGQYLSAAPVRPPVQQQQQQQPWGYPQPQVRPHSYVPQQQPQQQQQQQRPHSRYPSHNMSYQQGGGYFGGY